MAVYSNRNQSPHRADDESSVGGKDSQHSEPTELPVNLEYLLQHSFTATPPL